MTGADGRFTVEVFQDFLERLVKQQAGQKIFLIVDRDSVHKSVRIEKWLADKIEKIERNIFRNGRAKTKPELIGKLRGFLRSKQRRPGKVKNYFKGKYVTYAMAA